MSLEEIASKIKDSPPSHRPILIGIEGYGGSGKTTVAELLATHLADAYIVHMDDFIVKEKLAEPSWDKGSFDRERLERQILRPLSNGEEVSYQKLVWESGQLSDSYTPLPKTKYLIIEGISSYHPSIRATMIIKSG